uniref:Integration host factor, alpha subunit n=1 Tax=uncultured bacterium contig00054 TaxID=1181538 RepID=A0A806KNP5_9BACT|nr:integration host factor, alpha subunit [uncultured bacterium contig00054]
MAAKKFTKADIIDSLYEKTGMNRSEIRTAVDIFIDEIKEALVRRQIIELRGFGTFEVKVRKARPRARNPRTGESIVIRSHGAVAFRSGRELKQAVWNITDNPPDDK